MPELLTPRLRCSPLQLDDWSFFLSLQQDPQVMLYVADPRPQAGPHRIGKAFCLFVGRQADVKGDDTGCGKQRQLFTAPVIIAETAVLIIPQIAVDRRPPILGLLAEGRLRLAIALQAGEVGNGRLQLEQEGVQVDGDKLRRAYAGWLPAQSLLGRP